MCILFGPGGTENKAGTKISSDLNINTDDGDEAGKPGDVRKCLEGMLDNMQPLVKGKPEKDPKKPRTPKENTPKEEKTQALFFLV